MLNRYDNGLAEDGAAPNTSGRTFSVKIWGSGVAEAANLGGKVGRSLRDSQVGEQRDTDNTRFGKLCASEM